MMKRGKGWCGRKKGLCERKLPNYFKFNFLIYIRLCICFAPKLCFHKKMSHPVSQHNPPSLLHSPSPAMDTEILQRRRPSSDSHNNAVIGEKRLKRSEVLAKKKAVEELIRTANAERDHLASFPAYRHFQINGLSVCLKSGHGNKLSSSVKHYIQGLLKLNMEGPYGSEWPEEEKVKRREMVAPEARYIFVHEVANSNADDASAICLEDSGPLVGFVQYRFILEEEIPVLYVYELQLEPRIQGKGLGRFLMQLIELMAQKNCMGAVMLTVQKANLLAMNFYTSKLRYIISTMSPSKVNPMMEKSYEILCKTFSDEARTILEDSG